MAQEPQTSPFKLERHNMVCSQLQARGIRDQPVLAAFARVPREEFVAPEYRGQAYEDHPIPIGEDQTVSQPYIVALMLEALSLQPSDRVLEIGTGSGYLTALLCELTREVYSIERHQSLAQRAQSTLARLGYTNAIVLVGDGSQGLPDYAPFDAIIVSAAAPSIPKTLLEQLAEMSRMVVPVGPAQAQELLLVRKQNGSAVADKLEGCRFVPLIGDAGYSTGW